MQFRIFNNADSFAMSFDEEWQRINCDNKEQKINKVMKNLSNHPFLIANPLLAKDLANFRVRSLGKFK